MQRRTATGRATPGIRHDPHWRGIDIGRSCVRTCHARGHDYAKQLGGRRPLAATDTRSHRTRRHRTRSKRSIRCRRRPDDQGQLYSSASTRWGSASDLLARLVEGAALVASASL